MWSGRVADEADDEGGSGKGRIPLHRLRIEGDDGRVLEFVHGPRQDETPHSLRILREISYYEFAQCPICLIPNPTSREHVPPESLGGRVRTLVCVPCNNRLGSHLEGELLDWRDDAVRNPRVSAENVHGRRRLPRVLRRDTPDGKFVLIPCGPIDPALRDMLAAGRLDYAYVPPDPNRYKLAALKHAYLAACLDRCEIPYTPSAESIRADLLAARAASSGREVPTSDYAAAISLSRSYQQPNGPPLALALDDSQEVWILLAGTIGVPWPIPDFLPTL